ncbi:MAG TPA: cyclic dehypoxanthinyl futalosine synthase [Terriglobia bacterium]|nr:cyclic dehypoxanthinyl futalosine synthase [Terriglobia bacterium]
MTGNRITREQARELYAADLPALSRAASAVRYAKHPDRIVTYSIQRTVNYTNICNAYCSFCSFYRAPGNSEGYLLSDEQILEKIGEAMQRGASGILIQGGDHPELTIDYYEALLRKVKSRFNVWLHSFSASEIHNLAAVSGISLEEAIARLRDAGLDSIPGAGAEILDDEVRHRISPLKINTAQWLAVHRTAHRLGLRTTATMVFGFGETLEHRLNHLDRLRELQEETGGFAAFIVWPYQTGRQHPSILPKEKPSDEEYLRMQALARVYLDNIENVQASWLTVGLETGARALDFGANDAGSVVLEENVVAGAPDSLAAGEEALRAAIRRAGFLPMERDSIYSRRAPSLRERQPA